MLPQNHNVHQSQVGNGQSQPLGLPAFMSSNPSFDNSPSSIFNMDPSQAAKQMAALSAANQVRIANSRVPPASIPSGGTNSAPYLGGINSGTGTYSAASHEPSLTNSLRGQPSFQMPNNHSLSSSLSSAPPAFLDPTAMSHPNPTLRTSTQPNPNFKMRQQNFFNGLATMMVKRGTPLPPTLTGIQTPSYDPTTSPYKSVEVVDVGIIRLAGKDIDLLKLWGLVVQNGGAASMTNSNLWPTILPPLNLPDEIPHSQSNGSTPVAPLLAHYYLMLLQPFEDAYKRNIQDQHKRAQLASRQLPPQAPPLAAALPNQGRPQGVPNPLTSSPVSQFQQSGAAHASQHPMGLPQSGLALGPSLSATQPSDSLPAMPQSMSHPDGNVLDQDMQGIKRKLNNEEQDIKRVRQKTSSEPPDTSSGTHDQGSSVSSQAQISRGRPQPSRRRIEYVPLSREVETLGGRDLKVLESELTATPQRRPLRDINEWGQVDIDALTMSIRSRLAMELSYALTTFTLLSTMRGQSPGSGFPIVQSTDLFDEVLDLLEDEAFNADSKPSSSSLSVERITTNRELVRIVHEQGSQSFASLESSQGSKDINLGPKPRPAAIILAILNIIRNLSAFTDNSEYISRHERLLDILLRLCAVNHGEHGEPSAASQVLSLGDLILVRKDVLHILASIAGLIHFSPTPSRGPSAAKNAKRAFYLIASYLVDPVEAVPPLACAQLAGVPLSGSLKPPALADVALEAFTRLAQSDANRQIISQSISKAALSQLFVSLVHRLPVQDGDFQLATRELWLSYLEKTVMAIYSLAFLAPPDLKQELKKDRNLGVKGVMLRMIQKFLMNPSPEARAWFVICARRTIETMKVLDDAVDAFNTPQSTAPTMAFGMGYGEVGDNTAERGTGLLGGHRDVAWDILMMGEVGADQVMFAELESLARVEPT